MTNQGLTGAWFSGVAAADHVRLGKLTGDAAALEAKELSRADGGKSNRREVRRCDLRPLERPPQIDVPIRWGTGSAAAPEP